MKKTIFSLALGTFGLGMAEFGIMGVLPDMAHDVGMSIPAAGNMIAWMNESGRCMEETAVGRF